MDIISQVIGLALAFGLAIILYLETYKTFIGLMLWFNLFVSFMVLAGILPVWVFILTFIVCIMLIIYDYNVKMGKRD